MRSSATSARNNSPIRPCQNGSSIPDEDVISDDPNRLLTREELLNLPIPPLDHPNAHFTECRGAIAFFMEGVIPGDQEDVDRLAIFCISEGLPNALFWLCVHGNVARLYFYFLDSDRVPVLAKVLAANNTLTTLNISDNRIGDSGARAIAEALQENHTLTTLDISGSDIGDAGARAIAEVLRKNHTLTTLDISINDIDEAGARALAEALQENRTLKTLNISSNYIDVPGARAIAAALQENHALTALDISGNYIGDVGARAIAEALRKNNTLRALYLRHNFFGGFGAQAIARAAQENSILSKLDISSNEIGESGALAIADVLKKNLALTALRVYDSQINDAGAEAIAQALKENRVLKTLDISENRIGNAGVEAIAQALLSNATLTSLSVEDGLLPLSLEDDRFVGLTSFTVSEMEEGAPEDWALIDRRLQENRDAPAYINATTQSLAALENVSVRQEAVLPEELNNLLAQHLFALGGPGVETIKDLSAMARVLGRRHGEDTTQ